MIYNNIQELESALKADKEKASLNPVRFINVESMEMYIEVKKILLNLTDSQILLSTYCDDDTTPKMLRFKSDLRKTHKSVCILPISEYLRVKPELASTTLEQILYLSYDNAEPNSQFYRLYFLLYRLKDVLEQVPTDAKKKDCLYYLNTDEESDYKLTIIQSDLNVNLPGNSVNGFKQYLQYWESNPNKPLILHTNNAIHFENNNFFDNVQVIISSFELLVDQFKLPSNIKKNMGNEAHWTKLAATASTSLSFEEACHSIFSINKFSFGLYENWCRYDDYKKWLLWIWTKTQPVTNYLSKCAALAEDYNQFITLILTTIVDFTDSYQYYDIYKERKQALHDMKLIPNDFFFNMLSNFSSIKQLKCLTDLSSKEISAIFELIKTVDFCDADEYIRVLRFVYPSLGYYLLNDKTENPADLSSEHFNYFAEYKWNKATNNLPESFFKKVNSIALEKGKSVFETQSRNEVVNDFYESENTKVLFADGMGIEYIDYLAYLFDKSNMTGYHIDYLYGHCNLPSTTENNKDFLNGKECAEPYYGLDELKHSNISYPDNIIKEFSELVAIKDKAFDLLSGSTTRVIIAADHGTSRLAVLIRETSYDNPIPKPENTAIYKYGRFCEETSSEEEYPTSISFDNKLVFADYSRFKQKGTPIDEIHGGASLEEWIVPVIIIERANDNEIDKIEIQPLTPNVKINNDTQDILVKFVIKGSHGKTIKANINGTKCDCILEPDNTYSFRYKPTKQEHTGTVKIIDKRIIGIFEITITQPIQANKKFDI